MKKAIIKNTDGVFCIASNIQYKTDLINRDFMNLVNEVMHRNSEIK